MTLQHITRLKILTSNEKSDQRRKFYMNLQAFFWHRSETKLGMNSTTISETCRTGFPASIFRYSPSSLTVQPYNMCLTAANWGVRVTDEPKNSARKTMG